MSEPTTSALKPNPSAEAPGAWQRVVQTFFAPSRAFAGAGLGKAWWAPFLIIVVLSLGFTATVENRVGWDVVARASMANSPSQQQQFQKLTPDKQAAQMAMLVRITRISSYVASVVYSLLLSLIIAGLLLVTLNFGFGGHARFGDLFSLYMFTMLPSVLKSLLVIVLLFASTDLDGFQINNPLGSNAGYFLQGSSTPHWLVVLASWGDLFIVWQVILLVIGCAAVANISRAKCAVGIGIWLVLFIGVSGAVAAM